MQDEKGILLIQSLDHPITKSLIFNHSVNDQHDQVLGSLQVQGIIFTNFFFSIDG